MTVVNPDSIAGITSVTSSGTTLEFYDVNGNLLDVSANLTGELTVGTGATISSPGASIIDFETNGSERLRIGSSGQFGIAGANYGTSGQVLTSGGSGSAVSWTTIPTQVTISSNADNRVITGGSGTNLVGESNFTYDGNQLAVYAQTDDADCILNLIGKTPNGGVGQAGRVAIIAESTATNNGSSSMHLRTRNSSNSQLIAMTLDSNQNVGIGTQLPNDIDSIGRALNIASATGGAIYLQDTDAPTSKFAAISYNGGTAALQIHAHHSSSYIDFGTNGTERLRIDSGGRLLVGQTSNYTAYADSKIQVGAIDSTASIQVTRWSNNGSSPYINLGKSRGGLGSYTVVQSGDRLGQINFVGADGTDLASHAASIAAYVDGTPGSNDMPGRIVFATSSDGGTSETERLRIDSSGNVIVGGTSVGANGSFSIQQSGHVRTVLANGSGAGDTLFGAIGGVSNGFQINVDSSNNQNYYFHNGSSRTVSIRSTGNTEFGATGGNYGSNPRTVTIGSRAANIAGSLAIARGESLGGGTGPFMEFVHGPDGGTQRTHELYSYVGDFRIFADANENLELRGTNTIVKDSNNNILLKVQPTEIVTENNCGLAIYGGTGNHASDSVIYSEKTNNNDWCYKATASGGSSTDYGMYIRTAAAASYVYSAYDTTNSQWIFRVGGNGTIYAVNTNLASVSDRRLKENIVDANSQWNDIKALKFKNFTWKNSKDTAPKLGLISDEVEAVSPGLVEINAQSKEDIENNVPDPEYKVVKYSIVWMKAVKALQEAQERIEILEAKVAANEAGDTAYNAKIDKIIDYFKL